MKHPEWTEADSRRCKRIWAEYQKQHDITDRIGQIAGIDPKSERIWFGDSALEIVKICKQTFYSNQCTLKSLAQLRVLKRLL